MGEKWKICEKTTETLFIITLLACISQLPIGFNVKNKYPRPVINIFTHQLAILVVTCIE